MALAGEETVEPTFGPSAVWAMPGLRDEAMMRGYTAVDPATVVTTHLTGLVRDNLAEMLTYAETQKLLSELPQEYQSRSILRLQNRGDAWEAAVEPERPACIGSIERVQDTAGQPLKVGVGIGCQLVGGALEPLHVLHHG